MRGLHCLWPLQPRNSMSKTCIWFRTCRSSVFTALINYKHTNKTQCNWDCIFRQTSCSYLVAIFAPDDHHLSECTLGKGGVKGRVCSQLQSAPSPLDATKSCIMYPTFNYRTYMLYPFLYFLLLFLIFLDSFWYFNIVLIKSQSNALTYEMKHYHYHNPE